MGVWQKKGWILGILLFASPLFAEPGHNRLPEICKERLASSNILGVNLTPDQAYQKSHPSHIGNEIVRYSTVYENYSTTLSTINAQLREYKSPLFEHLRECREDKRNCHGYFNPDNSLHVKIFCDRAIYRSLIEAHLMDRIPKLQLCSSQPFNELSLTLLDELGEDFTYAESCFFEDHDGEKVVLKNKSETYLKDVKYLFTEYERMIRLTDRKIEESILPEGTKYILQKTVEEFEDLDIRKEKIRDINDYYHKLDLIYEMEKCCDGKDLLQEFQISINNVKQEAQNMRSSMYNMTALTFKVKDLVSMMIFNAAEESYWKEYLATRNVLDIPLAKREAYFTYVDENPFALHPKSTGFYGYVQDLDHYGREKMTPRIVFPDENISSDFYVPQYDPELGFYQSRFSEYAKTIYEIEDRSQLSDYDRSWVEYMEAMGYEPPGMFENYSIDLTDERDVMSYFIFDVGFQRSYLEDIKNERKAVEKEVLVSNKETFYPELFHGFLPYQFLRINQAKIIRELQKLDQQEVAEKRLFQDESLFVGWARSIICEGHATSFCKRSNAKFINEHLKKMHTSIMMIEDVFEYADERSPDDYGYIFGQSFVNNVNAAIQDINDFCFQNYPKPVSNEKEIKDVQEEFGEEFNELMDAFYSIDRLQMLLGEEEFFELLDYAPSMAFHNCFKKGAVFGKVSTKVSYTMSLVGANFGVSRSPNYELVSDLEALPDQEKKNASDHQIDLDDLHDVEDTMQERIDDENELLEEVFFYGADEYYKIEEFLKESVTFRIFAMLDYVKAKPSAEMGKYLCLLIESASDSEEHRQFVRNAIVYTAIGIATVATFFLAPAILGATAVMYELGVAAVFATIGAAGAAMEIKVIKYKQDMVSMSALSGNMSVENAMMLFESYDQQIVAHYWELAYSVSLDLFLGFLPFMKLRKFFRSKENSIKKMIKSDRRLEYEKIIRQINYADSNVGYGRRLRNILFDSDKVSKEQFEGFIKALNKGEDLHYLNNELGDVVGHVLPVQRMQTIPLSTTWDNYMTSLAKKADELVDGSKELLGRTLHTIDPSSNYRRYLYNEKVRTLAAKFPEIKYNKKILDILFDSGKVSNKQFEGFLKALEKGNDIKYLNKHLSDVLGLVTDAHRSVPRLVNTPKGFYDAWVRLKDLSQPARLVVQKYMNVFWRKVYSSKPWTNTAIERGIRWGTDRATFGVVKKWKRRKRLQHESRAVFLAEHLQKVQREKGLVLITPQQIDDMANSLEFFTRGSNGSFYRLQDQKVYELFNEFLKKVTKAGDGLQAKTIENYLEPIFRGELLDLDEIELILTKFDRPIQTIEDCESFLKVVKFAKKEMPTSGFSATFDPKVHKRRTSDILHDFNGFYDLAKYTKAKDTVKSTEKFLEIMEHHGLSADQLTSIVQKYDAKFTIKSKISNINKYKETVNNIDEATLTGKYQKQFLKHESDMNDYFLAQIDESVFGIAKPKKGIGKILPRFRRVKNTVPKKKPVAVGDTDKLGRKISDAFLRTRVRKSVSHECNLPDSIVKGSSNRAYVNMQSMITFSTSTYGYLKSHWDEEKDVEWFARLAFDTGMPYIFSRFQAKLFTTKGKSHAWKMFADWGSSGLGFVTDAVFYNYLTKLWWETDEEKIKDFEKKLMYAQDMDLFADEYFEDYPEIATMFDEKIELLYQTLDEVELAQAHGTMFNEEIENLFIKKGLIANMFSEDGLTEDDLEDDPIYSKLYEAGYLNDAFFEMPETPEEVREYLLEALTTIQYNTLYQNRSAELDGPLGIPLGEVDWDGIRTGDTGIPQRLGIEAEAVDRFIWSSFMYDPMKVPLGYMKNHIVYKFLCDRRFGSRNLLGAVLTHFAWKLAVEPFKYSFRENMTGR